MSLTQKQRVWLDEYLKCWNATEAARRAGYAYPNVDGPKNIVKPSLAEKIQQRLEEKAMGADEALARLADIARGDMADFPSLSTVADLKDKDNAHIVKKVRTTARQLKDGTIKVRTEVELYDALRALELIGKHHKLFTDRTEYSGPDGGPIVIKGYSTVSPDDWDSDDSDD